MDITSTTNIRDDQVRNGNSPQDEETQRTTFKDKLIEIVEHRVPITSWIRQYTLSKFLQDLLGGFTVGLTEIPQGIAYAAVAGLPPVYGLYSGIMGGLVYFFFGSCKVINIGPTAIMALMVHPYVVEYGPNMAVLLTFLSGIVIFILGLLHLGFLVEFFSYPIIAGFTSAAAAQIASTQVKSLLGIAGSADTFLEAWELVFKNIAKTRKWDVTLGLISIFFLVVLKEIKIYGSIKHRPEWTKTRNIIGRMIFFISLARNAIIVIIGTIIAYALYENGESPFKLTGNVEGGIPPFALPPFSTSMNGTNYNFGEMVEKFGTTLAFAPLVAILETIAIAKAFSEGKSIDATQEMLALGLCNFMGSFVSSMPITGSFTRTAVNHASGAKTTLSGVITSIVVLMALQFLTATFYFIPKATLASVVIVAMFYLFDFAAFTTLWRSKRLDLIPFLVTLLACVLWSLEYGILIGIAVNLIFVLYTSARPKLDIERTKAPQGDVYMMTPRTTPQFPAAEYIRDTVLADCIYESTVVLNGKYIRNTDATIAKSIIVMVNELEQKNKKVILWNFKKSVISVFIAIDPKLGNNCREGSLEEILEEIPLGDASNDLVFTIQ